jgi:ATP-dependent DNA ligase
MSKAIERFDFIKHEKFMDVAVEVRWVVDLQEELMITGYWWNQGFEKSFLCPVYEKKSRNPYGSGYPQLKAQTFKIKKNELSNWSKLVTPRKDMNCLRKCDWEVIK